MRLTEEPPKSPKRHALPEFACIYLSNILIINYNLYTISLNRYIFLLLPYGALNKFSHRIQ